MSHVRSMNRVILVGRVGRDPEVTHIPSIERDVAKFGLATSEGYMDKSNQWKESTEWHNIVAWGGQAQKVERSVSKGDMVLVEGKIRTRKWQDKEGQERRTTEIHVDGLVVLDKINRGGGGYRGGGAPDGGGDRGPRTGASDGPKEPPVRDINEFPYDDSQGDPF